MTNFDTIPHFAATYAEARARFGEAAKARGLAVTHHVHPTAKGAQGEELAIDVAAFGPPAARELLLLISATRGAEGLWGSGGQVGFLRDDAFFARMIASNARIVMLHALNPYGFSHLRRTNEDNIDLNRNFRDFATKPPPFKAYAEVHSFIVPAMWPPTPENEARIGAYIAAHGQPALQAAVSGGQCEFPDGLFYGGVRPGWRKGIP